MMSTNKLVVAAAESITAFTIISGYAMKQIVFNTSPVFRPKSQENPFNKLTSTFHTSELFLMMNFVIIMSN